MNALVAVLTLARHAHTPISEIEEMDWDRFSAYGDALVEVLKAEQPARK